MSCIRGVGEASYLRELSDSMQRLRGINLGPSHSSPRSDSGEVYRSGSVGGLSARGIVFIPSILNLDLAPSASVASLELGTPEMMARGRSHNKFSEFCRCRIGIGEGVSNGQPPAIGTGGLLSLITHGGGSPWRAG
jgi:hypothetical protein